MASIAATRAIFLGSQHPLLLMSACASVGVAIELNPALNSSDHSQFLRIATLLSIGFLGAAATMSYADPDDPVAIFYSLLSTVASAAALTCDHAFFRML